MSRERLEEIKTQLPLILRRHRLTRLSVLIIYAAVNVLWLSIVVIAIAVVLDDDAAGRTALGLVLAGTVVMLVGIGIAALSLAKSADAISYAVNAQASSAAFSRPCGPGPSRTSAGTGGLALGDCVVEMLSIILLRELGCREASGRCRRTACPRPRRQRARRCPG
jgi:Protein of unknown function (DUF2721)